MKQLLHPYLISPQLRLLHMSPFRYRRKRRAAVCGINAEIEFGGVFVKSEQKKINAAPKKQEPTVSEYRYIQFEIYAYIIYNRGHSEDGRDFPKSGFKLIESLHEDGSYKGVRIFNGNSFSGKLSPSKSEDGWVEGECSSKGLTWLKAHMHRKLSAWEEWTDIELRNIPIDETWHYYYREGWDCDKLRPDPEFEKSIVKIKHNIKFYPSGKEMMLDYIDYNRSEVQACKDWKNMAIPRSFIRVRFN